MTFALKTNPPDDGWTYDVRVFSPDRHGWFPEYRTYTSRKGKVMDFCSERCEFIWKHGRKAWRAYIKAPSQRAVYEPSLLKKIEYLFVRAGRVLRRAMSR